MIHFLVRATSKPDYSMTGTRIWDVCVFDVQGCGSLDPQGGKYGAFLAHLAVGIILVKERFSCSEHRRDNTSHLLGEAEETGLE